MTLNRRQLLIASGAAAVLGAGGWSRLLAAGSSKGSTKKVLFFTKSSGFAHSVVTRKPGEGQALAERILTRIGSEHGFEVVASKDGRLFDPDQIGQWDAFAFETTGDLTKPGSMDKEGHPISADGEKALYDAVRSGKGFMGMHCATDTFGHHRGQGADDPYIRMIGGEFSGYGPQQEAMLEVVDPDFPGVQAFGSKSFRINDEWYAQKHLADDLHVILVQVTKGMKGNDYQRPNYPETWTRLHGKGRVFYTSMGHREDVWENPKYQGLLLGAMGFITGKVDASTEPNIEKVTPGYKEIASK